MIRSLLSAFILIGACLAQDTLTVLPPASVTAPGTSGTVQINLSLPNSAAQPAGIEFTLTLAPANFDSVTPTVGAAATAAGKQLSCGAWSHTGTSSNLTCIVFGLNQTTMAAGTIATIALAVDPSVTTPGYAINVSNISSANATGTAITSAGVNGTLLIQNPCDLTGDGVYSLADLQALVNKAIAGGTCNGAVCNASDVVVEALVVLNVLACPVTGP